MSSALRLSMIMVLLLGAVALGLIALNASRPRPPAGPTAQSAPAPVEVQYLVAAHPLQKGALVRDDDVVVRSAPSAPEGAALDSPETRANLRGSLVRKFLDTGDAVTSDDVLRPRDRGFLAAVLAPDMRAVSIAVDAESGVSGLIWPGDLVDVVLTQVNEKSEPAHRALSETVLRNIRVIAIDQEIVEGVPANSATAGKAARSVSLQLTPEQVKIVAVARELGKLSLAVRAAVDQGDTADAGATLDCDVSGELARQSAIASQNTNVLVYAGGKARVFSVRKDDGREPAFGCDAARDVAVLTGSGDDKGGDEPPKPEEKR